MTLVLIPLVGVVLGVGLYAVLRSMGALNVVGSEPAAREERTPWRMRQRYDGPVTLSDRIEGIPRGCLVAIIAATGVWILGWLIVLVVGLNLLS